MNDKPKPVKLAKVIGSDDTNSGAPLLHLSSLGGDYLGVMIQPYGLTSCPPDNTYAVELPIANDTSNKMALAVDLAGRQKNLQPGESVLENTVTGGFAFFDSQGNLNISVPEDINLSATTININCATLNITANVAITGAFTVNGKNLSDTHYHINSGGTGNGGIVG